MKISDIPEEAEKAAKKTKDKIHDGAEKVKEGAEIVAEVATHPEELVPSRVKYAAKDFFYHEASGGIILVFASLMALILANTPFFGTYNYFLNIVDFRIGFADPMGRDFEIEKSVLHWVNDGLMAIFFFLVGLEIKREFKEGELSSRDKAVLPLMAAIGGMALPALIYFMLNQDNPAGIGGWAIPAATDIAFALGVLSLLGNRVPTSLKALLLGIAVIDDLGAILIIAVFFSHGIVWPALYIAAACIVVLAGLNYRRVSALTPYVVMAIILWVAVLESGIHATIAGVIAALFIPMRCPKEDNYSPVKTLEHGLHPWVAFAVLPIFGFANAGVPFTGMGWGDLLNPVTLGIAGGLFIGKQIGVFGMLWISVASGLSPKPKGTNWLQLYAVSLLCGIGFTMSLFIGGLAFHDIEMQASVRLGVLIGSIISALLAYFVLRYASPDTQGKKVEKT